jgi:hypothetical protein
MRREPNVKDLNHQLGNYVGEYITRRFLPTLSTDMLKTHTIVEVSEEDTERHKIADEALTKTYILKGVSNESKEAFAIFKALNNEFARKYLTEKLKCAIPKVYITDMASFKDGLYSQLWDTDLSHYFPKDDFYKQGHKYGWADHIILTLEINE